MIFKYQDKDVASYSNSKVNLGNGLIFTVVLNFSLTLQHFHRTDLNLLVPVVWQYFSLNFGPTEFETSASRRIGCGPSSSCLG